MTLKDFLIKCCYAGDATLKIFENGKTDNLAKYNNLADVLLYQKELWDREIRYFDFLFELDQIWVCLEPARK